MKLNKELTSRIVLSVLALCLGSIASHEMALAEGTEDLGACLDCVGTTGTGIAVAGTGMVLQPGTIAIDVPVGASVEQALLYWQGFMTSGAGDDTVTINSGTGDISVTGTLIGGPTFFFGGATASTYRADITSLALISDGLQTLTVKDMDYDTANNGAGLLVIYDDGSTDANIDVRDGSDLAFINFSPPLNGTEEQLFSFPPASSTRTAMIALFFSSVSGSASTGGIRPSSIEVDVLGPGPTIPYVFSNLLDSMDGDEWDTFVISVSVPPDFNQIRVEAFSRDDLGTGNLPASFDWNAAGLSIEPEVPGGLPGRVTGGGSVFKVDGARVTRGFQLHCDLRAPNNLQVNWPGGNKFHLTKLTGAVCTDSPTIDQTPPGSAPFDTFEGRGNGKLNGEPGASVHLVFIDAGEPGSNDHALIEVWGPGMDPLVDDPLLLVEGFLEKGNVQTHKDNKSTL